MPFLKAHTATPCLGTLAFSSERNKISHQRPRTQYMLQAKAYYQSAMVIGRAREMDAKKSCPLAAGTTKQTTSTQKLVRSICLGDHPAFSHKTEGEKGAECEPSGRFRCR